MLDDSYPLSPLQHAMLFRLLYARHPGVDLIHAWVDMRERLDEDRFRSAWERTVARHEALRTSFHWDTLQRPHQTVHTQVEMPFVVQQWRGMSTADQAERWRVFQHRDRMRGFDFDLPPFRIALFRLGWRHWRFCLTFHHIALDGAGLHLLMDEIFSRYDHGVEFPAAPRFRDYIAWHQHQTWREAEYYWRETLGDCKRSSPMPLALPRPASDAQRYSGDNVILKISSKTRKQIDTLAIETGVTVHTILQAAWALLLSRYNGSGDVVFGVTRRCRKSNVSDADRTMGMFLNTVALRLQVPENVTVAAWLGEVRKRWLAMRDFENTPLLMVQKWSGILRNSRLIETLLNFLDPSWDMELKHRGGVWKRRTLGMGGQGGDFVTLDVYPAGEELWLRMPCDPLWVDEETVKLVLGHYHNLLQGMCSGSRMELRHISTMEKSELRLVTLKWNQTAVRYPRDRCIHQLFEWQADRFPDAPAISYKQKILTYRQLEQRANRIARHLRDHGVRSGSMVGLCLERSVDLIAGMLAILKAGGTQVPLDPEYPPARLEHLLTDTGARWVLTHEKFRSRLPACGPELIFLDAEWSTIRGMSKERLLCETKAGDAACIFHTSGSTGTPKGVLVTHRGIVRLVKDNPYIKFGPEEKFLQFAPISFDASSFEIWGSLLNGAHLVLFPAGLPSLARLGEVIMQENITTLWMTTGLFAEMVTHWPARLRNVRQLLTGGSVMPPMAMRTALKKLPDCRIFNFYGPTENSTFTTVFEAKCTDPVRASIPIGKPIANTTVYVLDEHLQAVPIGVPGELYCGGDGIALGYLHAPGLTKEKFIADPYSKDPEARLYRTGDMVRWLPGGDLEFIGRRDSQVKIRGFRVEPEEVEKVLCQHPEVARAVVLARAAEDGGMLLHAWYESIPAASGKPEVRAYLREKLPAHMLPAILHRVETMPLKANGKIDMEALPTPDIARTVEYQSGVTPIQEVVRGIFCTTLGLGSVGMCEDFFELGGHSLKAMELVGSLEQAFELSMPVRTLFSLPTVEFLAGWIEEHQKARQAGISPDGDSLIVPISPGGKRPPVFVIPGGKGGDPEMLIFARLARYLPLDQPFFAIHAGSVQRDRLWDVELIARRYLKEIRRLHPQGPVLLVGECIAGVIAFEMARQSKAQGMEAGLILLDANCPRAGSMDQGVSGLLDTLRGDMRQYFDLLLGHMPGPYDGTVHIIASESNHKVDATLGWTNVVQGPVHVTVVPGDHDSYVRQEIAQTGAAVSMILDAALKSI